MLSSKDVMLNMNTIGLLSVIMYNFKKFKDIENDMEEIKMELMTLKHNTLNNNQQSTILFNKLNKRIDDNIRTLSVKDNMIDNTILKPEVVTTTNTVLTEEQEVLDAIKELKFS